MVTYRRMGGLVACAVYCAAFVVSTSCTAIRLAKYRDDRFLAEYRYTLGEQYLEVKGLKFCYQEYGEGPTVVILPGLATSIDFWQLNIPALAEHYHVVAVDLPGLGKSAKPDASYELPWMCDRILDFLDAKGISQASFIGGSMGGHLGLLLALNHPDRTAKLVMMGSTGAWPPPNLVLALGLKLLWNEWLVTDFVRGRWPDVYALMFKQDTELRREMFHYQMAIRADGFRFAAEGRATARALRSIFDHSCRSRLGDLHVPLLLIWGAYDEIHPPEDAMYIRRHAPDSRLVLVPDAGHEAMMDQPDTFNRVVLAFLESGSAGVQDSLAPP
ncbi:MAG TPA: alpha/beta hydrolase [Phycisphaerae bacterium]|nr:alpha/beta hydrolase [Phycisphaerae bacterium]